MNCEAFRHQLSIDPLSKDADFRGHARECPDCARAALGALRFEKALHRALAAEVSDVGTSGAPGPPSPILGVRLTLLALPLVLAAIWLAMRGGPGPDSDVDPGAEVIAHIHAEQQHLLAAGAVPWPRLRRLFRLLGADVNPSVGPVSFADRCVIGEWEGIHLVLPGERGAVTALFVQGQEMSGEREVAGAGLAGILLPVGFGFLAVVGVPGERLEPVVQRLRASLRWDGSDSIGIDPPRGSGN